MSSSSPATEGLHAAGAQGGLDTKVRGGVSLLWDRRLRQLCSATHASRQHRRTRTRGGRSHHPRRTPNQNSRWGFVGTHRGMVTRKLNVHPKSSFCSETEEDGGGGGAHQASARGRWRRSTATCEARRVRQSGVLQQAAGVSPVAEMGRSNLPRDFEHWCPLVNPKVTPRSLQVHKPNATLF